MFWEGEDRTAYDMTKGFVVLGSGTEAFLREKLEFLGLKEKEYEAFIEYWLPRMEGNPYNLITFQKEAYEETGRASYIAKAGQYTEGIHGIHAAGAACPGGGAGAGPL